MPERANSRGFLNPWYSSAPHTFAVCKDGNRQWFWAMSCEIWHKRHIFKLWVVSDEWWGGRDVACSVRRVHKSYNLTRIPRISQNITLNLLARFAWVKNLGRCTQTSLRFLFSCLFSSRHAELDSASVRGDVLEMARCEILKQVQDDICVFPAHRSRPTTHNSKICRICVICVPLSTFVKK